MEIIQLIQDFICDKYNLITFCNELKKNNDSQISDKISKNIDFKDMDKAIHAYLLIFIYKHTELNLNLQSENECYFYLQELADSINDYNIRILLHDKNRLIASIDNIYIFINHSSEMYSFDLPIELQNKTIFCINCNDDMKLKTTLKLPDYSFYAFINE